MNILCESDFAVVNLNVSQFLNNIYHQVPGTVSGSKLVNGDSTTDFFLLLMYVFCF